MGERWAESGEISGAVTAGTAAQTIAPGLPGLAGTLTIGGLTTNTGTTLALGLGSPDGGSDLLAVTGNVSLNGGTVSVASLSSAGAASLGYYSVLSYAGTLTGATSTLVLPAMVNNVEYTLDTTRDPGFVDLHRGYIGDANDDGTVDLNDLNVVLNNLGATTTSWGNGNFDGAATIDLTDLNDVLNDLGTGVAAGSGMVGARGAEVTATPEPASLLLAAVALPAMLRKRRRS